MVKDDTEEIDKVSKVINDINLRFESIREPTFYYYKRWLWIMFPWACLQSSSTYNFSMMISKCFSSNIKYLSVTEDRLLTNRSLYYKYRLREDCEGD